MVTSGNGTFSGSATYTPAWEENGCPSISTSGYLDRLPAYPAIWSGKHVGVRLGANDSADGTTYYNNLVDVTQAILDAGKTPVLATLTWQSGRDMSALAAQVHLVIARF
jgi:hypothetical protein